MNKPEPRLIRTPDDAEKAARDWMRYTGFVDAHMFPGGGTDEGVDVRSSGAVAQVKATVGAVGRPVIQQIYGIAELEDLQSLVFSLGGYTDEAIEWASKASVALFQFDLTGEPKPVNRHARELLDLASGIEPMTWDVVEAMIADLNEGDSLVLSPFRPDDKNRWTVQRIDNRFYYEIPPNELGKEFRRLWDQIDQLWAETSRKLEDRKPKQWADSDWLEEPKAYLDRFEEEKQIREKTDKKVSEIRARIDELVEGGNVFVGNLGRAEEDELRRSTAANEIVTLVDSQTGVFVETKSPAEYGAMIIKESLPNLGPYTLADFSIDVRRTEGD